MPSIKIRNPLPILHILNATQAKTIINFGDGSTYDCPITMTIDSLEDGSLKIILPDVSLSELVTLSPMDNVSIHIEKYAPVVLTLHGFKSIELINVNIQGTVSLFRNLLTETLSSLDSTGLTFRKDDGEAVSMSSIACGQGIKELLARTKAYNSDSLKDGVDWWVDLNPADCLRLLTVEEEGGTYVFNVHSLLLHYELTDEYISYIFDTLFDDDRSNFFDQYINK